jgi:putative nucleotidyltransferase with HDIG domain
VPQQPPPTSDRVLIVDDDASFGAMVGDTVAEKGYAAVIARSPEEALRHLSAGPFAAAILDLHMPGMTGLQLADRIREASPDTAIVIMTGQADMDSAIEGIHRGIFDYLPKISLDFVRLQRAVSNAVERSRLAASNRELVTRLKESNRLLKALNDVAAGLSGEAYLDRLLVKVVAAAKELCGADAGRVVLFDRSNPDVMIVSAAAGDGAETLEGTRVKRGEGLTASVAESDQPVVLGRPTDDPRFSRRADDVPTTLPGYLCAPLRHGGAFGALTVAGRLGGFGRDDGDLVGSLARQAAVAVENALTHEHTVNFFTHTSEILVSFLEAADVHYPGHSRRVAALADMVTRRLGLSETERRTIHFAALLHDIGKTAVDPAVLKAPGPLNEHDRALLRKHPELGVQLLKPITLWEDLLPVILSHHERWDGTGYPGGLAGEAIPLGARVVAVADAFDAMTRSTPHGPQRSAEEALAELERCAAGQFDPRIVRLFTVEYRQHGDQIG